MATEIMNILKASENIRFWAKRVIDTKSSRSAVFKSDAVNGLVAAARMVCFEQADKVGGFANAPVSFHLSNKIAVLKHKNLFFGGEAYSIKEIAE